MAIRVTGSEVLEILDTTLISSELTPFITVASLIVDEKLATSGLSAALLKEIERWLAAHFASIRDPRLVKVKVDDIEETYAGKTYTGLSATLYGQQAIQIDTSGTLKTLGRKKVSFTSIDLGLS